MDSKDLPKDFKSFISALQNDKADDFIVKAKLDRWGEFAELQIKFLMEKNIIFSMDIDKFLSYNLEEIERIMNISIELYLNVERKEKETLIKFRPILKQLKKKTMKNLGFISGSKKLQNKSTTELLDPKYVYTISIKDGEIVSVLPVSKN